MSKNIAIIIGISEYTNAHSLNGCKVDADSIRTLLDATGKYDEILQMDGKIDADEINQKVPEFIKKFKTETIEEVFFYFSGHGCIVNDEFVYVASDYDSSRKNATTISNATIDILLKSLNANLVVKIIDACHSGIQYVKDIDLIPKYINQHKDEFANCYFMFSSRTDQPSEATSTLSVFTRSFIQAIKSCGIGRIKYTSIADFIADDFVTNPKQKPQFVKQADLTEVFCDKDAKIDGILDTLLNTGKANPNPKPVETDSPLIRAIKLDGLSYRTEEQIYEILDSAKDGILALEHRKDILDAFDCEFTFPKETYGFTKKSEIGEWLSKEKHNYYAKTERTTYEQLNNWIFAASSIGQKEKTESQENNTLDSLFRLKESFISGYTSLMEFPYGLVRCVYMPKFPNLSAFKIQLAFVCSNTELALFSYTTEIKNVKEMKDFSEITPLTVSTIKFVDGDIHKKFIEQILIGEDAIIAKLKNQYLNAPDSSIG